MKLSSKRLVLSLVAVVGLFIGSAQATVIDFEDIVNPGCCTFPVNGYQGFNWSGGFGNNSWVIGEESADTFLGQEAYSGNNFAWSNGGTDLSLSSGVFDFYGFWARAGWGSGFTATITGLLNGSQVYTQQFSVTDIYQQFIFNFSNIDTLTITNQGTNLLVDDIGVNVNIPEPGTLTILGLGLLALGFRRIR